MPALPSGLRLTSDRVKAILFQLDSPKMILTLVDAIETLELGENEEEALNEVSVL
jgi:hypothetical protein